MSNQGILDMASVDHMRDRIFFENRSEVSVIASVRSIFEVFASFR